MKPDEYLNEDGIVYCKNCGTPRQLRISIFDREQLVPISCRCQLDRINEQRRKEKKRDFRQRVLALRKSGLSDERFPNTPLKTTKAITRKWKRQKLTLTAGRK